MNPDGLLVNLNASQQAAVSSFADTLAILAGPGSGKTHTLTSRTAWLLAQGLQPCNVIVATFTVKAAREMKERIGKLIGNGLESKLILGTFHSIARRYLARYGHLIEIRKDFGIADTADSLAIIKRIVKRNNFIIDPKVARSRISSHKSRMGQESSAEAAVPKKSVEAQEFEICYAEYEEALKRSNLLDYDDLLLRCADLLRLHPSCVSNVEAVLIDEFQDTNLVQFDLMRLFASQRKRITIVGDPDQSIYGFRAAETKNYKRLIRQYPDTITIALEENYRSSGAILNAALSVIQQDTSRVDKSLTATHTVGTRPVLRRLANAHKEAEWLVTEICRCRGMAGDLLDLNDFAILLRSSALSRLIESALGKAGIAYRMVGGLRFYDRLEIKTLLDYLRVINQPDNNDAVSRILNIPSRRIGEVTIKSLLEEADQSKTTLWSLVLDHVQGKRAAKTKLPKQTEAGLRSFADIILKAKSKIATAEESCSITEILKFVIKKTNFENWLEEHHGDVAKGRWENVEELMTQASDFQDHIDIGYEDESLPEVDGVRQEDQSDPLSRFLANVALASEVKRMSDEEAAKPEVTISTIHAAKGLEWPVVFIPAAYKGSIPHSRSEDTDEERRLLYVAMTRAKSLLYMSCPTKNSQGEEAVLSPFLSTRPLARLLDPKGPSLPFSEIKYIAHILRRSIPTPTSIVKSSSCLQSTEDTLFAINPDEEKHESESRWRHADGNPTFTMGQRAPKRQRVELGRSTSNVESVSTSFRIGHATTTMERMSSSRSATTTTATFSSARTHMQVLTEQSVNCAKEKEQPEMAVAGSKSKITSTKKDIAQGGQGTLFSFLGKADPERPQRSLPRTEVAHLSQSMALAMAMVNQPRTSVTTEHIGISPELAGHSLARLKATKQNSNNIDVHARNEYIFLSSSPPREKKKAPPPSRIESTSNPEPQRGLTNNPSLLPLIRPATTMHSTSIAALQNAGPKKTLGMRRGMNGWASKKGQAFVPPTMKDS